MMKHPTSSLRGGRWQNIINEAQSLTSTAEIRCLLNAAGGQVSSKMVGLICENVNFIFALVSCYCEH